MPHKKIFFSINVIFAILFLNSCNRHVLTNNDPGQKFCIPDSLLKNITFDTIHLDFVSSELALSGKIAVNDDKVVKIFPLVSGQVSEVKVSLGDYVEKGKVLAIIRSSDMAGYYNELISSQGELAVAKKNLEVTGSLLTSGVSSEKDLLVAQNEYQKALAQFNKINEVLKINGSSFPLKDSTGSGYLIKAPISGFIVVKNVTGGMDIRPDANDALFIISDLNEVWATANVFETDIPKIQVGMVAEVTTLSYPDKKFSGKVERISNILDPDTKVMSVKINLENEGFILKPGMFAHITIRIPENRSMLAIKNNAIIYSDNESYLLRYRSKCDVSVQKVSVFKSLNNQSFIESDSLRNGDVVIQRGGLFIFTALINL